MHEIGIAAKIIDIVAGELSKRSIPKARMRSVRVTVGKLMQIVPESLGYSLEIVGKQEGFPDASYQINESPLEVVCNKCGFENMLSEVEMVCAGCGAFDLRIKGGRELRVESIDIED